MPAYEYRQVKPEELREICRQMEETEKNGEFDGLFKGERGSPEVFPDSNKEGFLASFNPKMKLFKSTFIKIYGYELTWPGFADIALDRLEVLGCSKAREYYSRFVTEYEFEHEKEMVKVAKWYKKQLEKERGEQVRKRQREAEQRKLSRKDVAREFLKW